MIDPYIKKNIKNYINEFMPAGVPVPRFHMFAILSYFGIVFIEECYFFETKMLAKIVNDVLECDAIIKGAFDTWSLSCQFIEWIGIPDPGRLHEDCHGVGCYK